MKRAANGSMNMIISKTYAKKLEAQGKAKIENCTTRKSESPDATEYRLVTRYDVQRIDHYVEA